MIRYLKKGKSQEELTLSNQQIKVTVENILADIDPLFQDSSRVGGSNFGSLKIAPRLFEVDAFLRWGGSEPVANANRRESPRQADVAVSETGVGSGSRGGDGGEVSSSLMVVCRAWRETSTGRRASSISP